MRKPETALRRRIVTALEEKFPSAVFFKIHGSPYQDAGIPDLICCVQGAFVGLEIKIIGGGGPTAIQISMGNRILKAEGHWATVRSPEEAIKEVTEGINRILTPY